MDILESLFEGVLATVFFPLISEFQQPRTAFLHLFPPEQITPVQQQISSIVLLCKELEGR